MIVVSLFFVGVLAESEATLDYPFPVPFLITFALSTESTLLSVYTYVRSCTSLSLVLFYLLLLWITSRLLGFSGSQRSASVTYKIVDEAAQHKVMQVIDQHYSAMKGTLLAKRIETAPSLQKELEQLCTEVQHLKMYQEQLQQRVFESHRDIAETLERPSIPTLVVPTQTGSDKPFPFISRKDQPAPQNTDFLVPPEGSVDSADSYLPPEEELQFELPKDGLPPEDVLDSQFSVPGTCLETTEQPAHLLPVPNAIKTEEPSEEEEKIGAIRQQDPPTRTAVKPPAFRPPVRARVPPPHLQKTQGKTAEARTKYTPPTAVQTNPFAAKPK